MKYFTRELWLQMNSEIEEEAEEAERQWTKNIQEYVEKYREMENRLPKRTYDFFLKNSFHDCRVEKMELIHEQYGSLDPIKIKVTVTDEVETWEITYKGVSKIMTNYQNDKTPFSTRRGFDNWGYDELLIVDENTLSHEILFASGAVLLVHFKNKGLSIAKLKRTQPPTTN